MLEVIIWNYQTACVYKRYILSNDHLPLFELKKKKKANETHSFSTGHANGKLVFLWINMESSLNIYQTTFIWNDPQNKQRKKYAKRK